MALSKPKLATIGLLSSGGLGGVGIIANNLINKETFKDKLKATLLTASAEDEIKWAARLSLLSNDNSSKLSDSLKAIKTSNSAEKLKAWCNTNLKESYSEEGQLFKDIQKYCAYSIKEKLTKRIDTNNWKPDQHNKKLSNMEDNKLSPKMLEIKNKLKAGSGSDTEALKKWCISLENVPYKNENDQVFKDGKTYCTNE